MMRWDTPEQRIGWCAYHYNRQFTGHHVAWCISHGCTDEEIGLGIELGEEYLRERQANRAVWGDPSFGAWPNDRVQAPVEHRIMVMTGQLPQCAACARTRLEIEYQRAAMPDEARRPHRICCTEAWNELCRQFDAAQDRIRLARPDSAEEQV